MALCLEVFTYLFCRIPPITFTGSIFVFCSKLPNTDDAGDEAWKYVQKY